MSTEADREAKLKNDKAEFELEKAKFEAWQARVQAFLPDLSSIQGPTLEADSVTQPAVGSGLSFGALAQAAKKVAERIHNPNGTHRILITSDPDLATPTSIARDVIRALTTINTAAVQFLNPPLAEGPPSQSADDAGGVTTKLFDPASAALAAVSLVPQVISLFASKHSLSSGATTPSDLAAVSAVAGAIKELPNFAEQVVLDDYRVAPEGVVQALCARLDDHRRAIAQRQADLPPADKRDDLQKKTATAIEALLTQIDAFNIGSRTVPAGAKRSALATATLYAPLVDRTSAPAPFTHVLLIKAQPGGWSQLLTDKSFLRDDTIHQVAEANMAYTLISAADSQVVRSGIATATRTGTARIGGALTIL